MSLSCLLRTGAVSSVLALSNEKMVVHSAIVMLNRFDSFALFCAAIFVRSVCLR